MIKYNRGLKLVGNLEASSREDLNPRQQSTKLNSGPLLKHCSAPIIVLWSIPYTNSFLALLALIFTIV